MKDKSVLERDLSCTFCGPGTWSVWDVVTDDGVVYVCDHHHVEMSEAQMIRLERRVGNESWRKVNGFRDRYLEE